jgi:hypothetical protein
MVSRTICLTAPACEGPRERPGTSAAVPEPEGADDDIVEALLVEVDAATSPATHASDRANRFRDVYRLLPTLRTSNKQ